MVFKWFLSFLCKMGIVLFVGRDSVFKCFRSLVCCLSDFVFIFIFFLKLIKEIVDFFFLYKNVILLMKYKFLVFFSLFCIIEIFVGWCNFIVRSFDKFVLKL